MHLAGPPPLALSATVGAGKDTAARLSPAVAEAVLDSPDEWTAFSRAVPEQPHCWESHVLFEGMHCAACALSIEDALGQVPGVQSVQVNAASHRGRIVWSDQTVKPSVWMAASARAGYPALPANDASTLDRRRAEARRALWRMGVAGLCMMQVMMYAFPGYVSIGTDLTLEMVHLLRWAAWVLSLPVLIFSCTPFFANAFRDLRQRRVSMDLPVALGMLITFGVSSMGTFAPLSVFGAEVYFDSFTMFVFFLLTGRWLELRLRERTAGALEALMNRMPDSVERRRADGSFERIAVRRLAVGDQVRVLPGEAFPADGVILEGRTLADEALLTGESRPLARAVGDGVIAASYNLSAPVLVRIERLGGATRFAQIVALMESASLSKPQLAVLADAAAKPFLIFVLLAALGAGAYWWGRDPGHALMVAVSVLIVTCPCALSLATPAAMLASAGALAKRGVLVRRLQALEALARIDTVVFDKTGTLTHDTFALDRVTTRAGLSEAEALQRAAALARHSLHPVSRALVGASQLPVLEASGVDEVAGQGVRGQVLLEQGARQMRLGSAVFCGAEAAAGDALQASLADEDGWLATFELREALRPDAAATVQALLAQGVQVQLLSGDRPDAAARVAGETGITRFQGGCTPQDKLAQMRQWQAQGRQVAMVGDGMNDGPVMAGAQVSFAIGKAVPLAHAQSDFVLLGEQLAVVAQTLAVARRTIRVVRQNLWWAAIYNAVCVPLAVLGLLPAWLAGLGMALSSLLVVLNALRLAEPVRLQEGD